MTDNTDKHKPIDYQDELDVYEAVRKLEEKYGKTILNPEQKKKLEEAGRVVEKDGVGKDNNKNKQVQKKKENMSAFRVLGVDVNKIDKDKMKLANRATLLLLGVLDDTYPEMFSGSEWEGLGVKDRGMARAEFFRMMYGMSPRQCQLEIYAGLLEGAHE